MGSMGTLPVSLSTDMGGQEYPGEYGQEDDTDPELSEAEADCFKLQREDGQVEQSRDNLLGGSLAKLGPGALCGLLCPILHHHCNTPRKPRRLVGKDGSIKLRTVGWEGHRGSKWRDGFHTCMDWRWRQLLTIITATLFGTWFLFGLAWHLLCWAHGDLEPGHLPSQQERNNYTPCVFGIEDFTSSFLLSVEIQHTIGFGYRGSTHKCQDAVALQCVQSVVGVLLEAALTGVFFVKLSRPKRRQATVVFSRNAVISLRNGSLRLMFRVANLQSSQLLEAHVRAQMVTRIVTEEGEEDRHHQVELGVSCQLDKTGGEPDDRGLMILPLTVSHTLEEESPLYHFTPGQLLKSRFEIIVCLEGIVEPSGNTTQARSSYLPEEILWAHRFRPCVRYDSRRGEYTVDLSRLNSTVRDQTPWLSAHQLGKEN